MITQAWYNFRAVMLTVTCCAFILSCYQFVLISLKKPRVLPKIGLCWANLVSTFVFILYSIDLGVFGLEHPLFMLILSNMASLPPLTSICFFLYMNWSVSYMTAKNFASKGSASSQSPRWLIFWFPGLLVALLVATGCAQLASAVCQYKYQESFYLVVASIPAVFWIIVMMGMTCKRTLFAVATEIRHFQLFVVLNLRRLPGLVVGGHCLFGENERCSVEENRSLNFQQFPAGGTFCVAHRVDGVDHLGLDTSGYHCRFLPFC
jgi:hypothetical protein